MKTKQWPSTHTHIYCILQRTQPEMKKNIHTYLTITNEKKKEATTIKWNKMKWIKYIVCKLLFAAKRARSSYSAFKALLCMEMMWEWIQKNSSSNNNVFVYQHISYDIENRSSYNDIIMLSTSYDDHHHSSTQHTHTCTQQNYHAKSCMLVDGFWLYCHR